MPGDGQEPLTAAEWKVMKIVWRRKECATREVYEEAAAEFGWSPSTTKTLLRRLTEIVPLPSVDDFFALAHQPRSTVS